MKFKRSFILKSFVSFCLVVGVFCAIGKVMFPISCNAEEKKVISARMITDASEHSSDINSIILDKLINVEKVLKEIMQGELVDQNLANAIDLMLKINEVVLNTEVADSEQLTIKMISYLIVNIDNYIKYLLPLAEQIKESNPDIYAKMNYLHRIWVDIEHKYKEIQIHSSNSVTRSNAFASTEHTVRQSVPIEDDYGNSRAEAAAISLNTDINGKIETTGDIDYFKFTLSEESSVDIYYNSALYTNIYVRLYDNYGNQLEGIYSQNDHIIKNLSAGTYYVTGSDSGDLIDYTIRVNSSDPLNDDYGNTRTEAAAISLNTDINGKIETTGDIDYFKFTLSEESSVDIYYNSAIYTNILIITDLGDTHNLLNSLNETKGAFYQIGYL